MTPLFQVPVHQPVIDARCLIKKKPRTEPGHKLSQYRLQNDHFSSQQKRPHFYGHQVYANIKQTKTSSFLWSPGICQYETNKNFLISMFTMNMPKQTQMSSCLSSPGIYTYMKPDWDYCSCTANRQFIAHRIVH